MNNPPETGKLASKTILSLATATATITIGGKNALVLFAGLAPHTVGEYQVNVRVPEDVAAGSELPLIMSIGGAVSNTVTIAVK